MRDYALSTRPSDGGPAVVVSYSIGTDRDDLIQAWERATPIFDKRLRAIERLRAAGLFVVATLSPFGPWRDLPAALVRFRELGVSYITCLFFKAGTPTANTPRRFLDHVRREHPFLLDPLWQREMEETMKEIFGEDRVLVGQRGFASLTRPHRVTGSGPESARDGKRLGRR
jgi:DNA repair photolyase